MKNLIKRSVKPLLLILASALTTGILMYFYKPNKAIVYTYPWDLKAGKQFSCATKMGATFFARPNFEKHTSEIIDGHLFTDDKTKMAIEIDGKSLKMLTATSVEAGMTEPAVLVIIREDDKQITAIDLQSDISIDQGVGTFILNKKSGTAVWTKSKPSFFSTEVPEVQAYYMECR